MPYITTKQSPRYAQLTFEEVLNNTVDVKSLIYNDNTINTRTIYQPYLSDKLYRMCKPANIIKSLKKFCDTYNDLYESPREELYNTFYIPKKSGGLRKIDQPLPRLMEALRDLKDLFESCGVFYHTSAFAYVKGRCAVDAVRKHQANSSNWFAKFDFTNFFGSVTEDFCFRMVVNNYPFCVVNNFNDGEKYLRKALNLCFLNGGLPQGTPISPMLTNLIMIPIDHYLSNYLKKSDENIIYTRYADDILISSRKGFNPKEIESKINEIIKGFDAPLVLNPKKTRYGSRAGRNWNLGVMLNKDNEITIGHKKKDRFKAMIHSYVSDKQHGIQWDLHDVQVFAGLISYYSSIERDNIDGIIKKSNVKYNTDLMMLIKKDLTV